ncbi:hypothetical protein TTHERM_00925410 (macronuclear) [Tetrahymena thermophila SB210]|uniref:Uncharacterized protein n=1 Tax=Tetrahymena thermophila (strain SB210) TaxID=312017 RepID=Q22E17_TETTS|nr:hypothetical protein TTHERM_00925410 [Tetrahymena thermophila SB210]EAR83495.2 hypothetical protein TTHERM_00925410 [Tetrahymena thermophila SB210]|eukprot:XP_001031158.2 hypothetical protein TTHERM_00925410 [Tetrahymena thermophila SB210]
MALTFTPNNPIIPLRLGIKHDPPTLALVYKRKQQDIKERIYSIVLNGLVELSDPKIIALKLFEEHALILNENVIDIDQVEKLVAELQKRYEEKKALQQFSNPITKDMISPIHTYQSANKNPYNIQDNDTDMFLDNTQTNPLQSNNFHHENNESIQNEYNDQSYQQQNLQSNLLTLQTPVQNNNNISNNNNVSNSIVDQFNQNQLSDDGELFSSGYNPSFSTKAGSASEQKRQKVKSKNEKNKMNLGATHKNLNELIQGSSENNMQQYINSHYNYGQRKNNNNEANYLNENNLDNEFIDEQQLYNNNINNDYNEDYHDLMNEDNYLYQNNNNNYNTQHIQIPQSIQGNSNNTNFPNKKNNQNNQMWPQNNTQNTIYPFQNNNMKGYIDTQMDYQQNFNNYQDNFAINNNYQNNNAQYQNNLNNFNQASNAPFFSKRQSQSMGNQQAYEPQFDNNSKKRRSKLGELRELANQHRDINGNVIDDQLEVI